MTPRAALDLVAKAVVRDPAWRAKRMKEAQQAAASMPNADAFLKQIEESIRVEEETLAKEVSPSGGSGTQLADARQALADVTGWISGLSAAEQSAPACYVARGAALRDKFRTVPSAGCHPLARPNYAYFNSALPRSAPQVVILTPVARCFDTADRNNRDANSPSPAGCRANRGLVESLDKAALKAWLR